VKPFLSIVVPIRNEEAYIERLARSLLEQDYPHDRYEIVMADGGSTDRTRALLASIDTGGRIRILDNPGRTAPAALNVAIAASRGEIVVRVDGHSFVAPDYLTRIVAVIEETGSHAVGGPVRMLADTPFRKALVEALYAKVAVGSVPYRTLTKRAEVESLQTGAFRRDVLERVGPFDEALAVVEDLDMNTRIRKAGFTLLLDPSIRFWYLPRPSLGALWRQIYAVGLVKARILRKHPDIFKWKYVLPTAFVFTMAAAVVVLAASAMGGPRGPGVAAAVVLAAYALVVIGFSVSRLPRLGWGAGRLLAILPTLHVGYGLGYLSGATEKLLGREAKPPGAP
jgi:succinoglycan biosynthesis protein ExoA